MRAKQTDAVHYVQDAQQMKICRKREAKAILDGCELNYSSVDLALTSEAENSTNDEPAALELKLKTTAVLLGQNIALRHQVWHLHAKNAKTEAQKSKTSTNRSVEL